MIKTMNELTVPLELWPILSRQFSFYKWNFDRSVLKVNEDLSPVKKKKHI